MVKLIGIQQNTNHSVYSWKCSVFPLHGRPIENLRFVENAMKMIEAITHPSGSSCGASKESRTFSFWRLATESENCDFLNVP